MPWGEEYTGATLVDMYLAELAAHTWDLAQATEQLDRLGPLHRCARTRGGTGHDQTAVPRHGRARSPIRRRFPHRPAPTTGNASPPSWDATHGHR